MLLSDFQTAVKRLAGVDDSDPLTLWINSALFEFVKYHSWPFLETLDTVQTVIGDEVLAVPQDTLRILKVRIVTEKLPLKFLTRLRFEDEIDDPTEAGKPIIFTLVGQTNVILWKVPDEVYDVRIYRRLRVNPLIAPTDQPTIIPPEYHWAIVEGAAAKALQAESEEERAVAAHQRFLAIADKAVEDLTGRVSGTFGQVRDVMGYGTIT